MEWKVTVTAEAAWTEEPDAVQRGSALLSLLMGDRNMIAMTPMIVLDQDGANFTFTVDSGNAWNAADRASIILSDILKASGMDVARIEIEKGDAE